MKKEDFKVGDYVYITSDRFNDYDDSLRVIVKESNHDREWVCDTVKGKHVSSWVSSKDLRHAEPQEAPSVPINNKYEIF